MLLVSADSYNSINRERSEHSEVLRFLSSAMTVAVGWPATLATQINPSKPHCAHCAPCSTGQIPFASIRSGFEKIAR